MSKIHNAARTGNLEMVRELLEKGVDVNSREFLSKWSPLHCAAKSSHLKVVRLLLDRGADINAIGSFGTSLHNAGDAEMVRELLAAGADPLVSAGKGLTPLHTYSREGNSEIVVVLLDAGVNVDVRDEGGNTPLCQAAAYGRTDTARVLLERGADVNVQTNNSHTPLDLVVALGNTYPETIEFLKTAGGEGKLAALAEKEQERKTREERAPEFISAVKAGDVQKVQQLLDKGYDANLGDGDTTALHWALIVAPKKKDKLDIARLLISSGADVNIRTKTGQTPSQRQNRWHASSDNPLAVDDISSFIFGDLDTAGLGLAPLDLAAMYDNSEIARLLIEAGADVNAAGEDGETALHLSALFIAEETARLLLNAGADVNALTRDVGQTPLDWAIRRLAPLGSVGSFRARTKVIVEFLRDHGGVESGTWHTYSLF